MTKRTKTGYGSTQVVRLQPPRMPAVIIAFGGLVFCAVLIGYAIVRIGLTLQLAAMILLLGGMFVVFFWKLLGRHGRTRPPEPGIRLNL
jgi:high-affinity Fe2+/Pb2+ permease